jgi:eukaryotic-like serine/threonine-protein kinase
MLDVDISNSRRKAVLPSRLAATVCVEPDENPRRRDDYAPGEVIAGRYRLVRELARGGMGVVWVAHALMLGIDVALKFVRPDTATEIDFARIEREAQAAARCSHPALVRVFDFGWTDRGDPYLVMELLVGELLSTTLEREGRLSAVQAVRALLPIVDALRTAHQCYIVHRDIKPHNIIVACDPGGTRWPKLLDFGIAKFRMAARFDVTAEGVVVGSPEYMSPEQATGCGEVDARSDVWSLCATLYHLTVGVPPFHRAAFQALVHAILHEAPTPITESAVGDSALWAIIARGLAKDPGRRIGSMSELGAALARWLLAQGVGDDWSRKSLRSVWLERPIEPRRFQRQRRSSSRPGLAVSTALLVAAVGVTSLAGQRATHRAESTLPHGTSSVRRESSKPLEVVAAPRPAGSEALTIPSGVPVSALPKVEASPASKAAASRGRYHEFGF